MFSIYRVDGGQCVCEPVPSPALLYWLEECERRFGGECIAIPIIYGL